MFCIGTIPTEQLGAGHLIATAEEQACMKAFKRHPSRALFRGLPDPAEAGLLEIQPC